MDKFLTALFWLEVGNYIYSKATRKDYELLAVHITRFGIKSYNDFCKAVFASEVINSINGCGETIDGDYREVV